MTSDPNLLNLLRVARAIKDSSEFVFVGGATLGLLITDTAAREIRPTTDVDLVVGAESYASYQREIGGFLRSRGFQEMSEAGAPICAWLLGGLRVDIMPSDSSILGFSNPWYREVLATSESQMIEGVSIQVVSPACFLATKVAAFDSRGEGDFYGSHDLEDIVALIDGRDDIVEQVVAASAEVSGFLRRRLSDFLGNSEFLNALPGHVEQGRAPIVLGRMKSISQ